MLGKTHVVGSLALLHMGFLGYTLYANQSELGVESGAGDYVTVFGLPIGEPLSLAEYSLMVLIISCFIMVLLRIGGVRSRVVQVVSMVIGSVSLYFIAEGSYPLTITMVFLSFALGSVLPDIDSEDSTIGKYIKPISRAIPHRTITHTIWAVLLLGGLAWVFESIHLAALTLGYFIHIVQDSFSDKGIRWFYPVPKLDIKRLRSLLSYEVGGLGETIVFIASIGINVLCTCYVIWLILA